MLTALFAAAVAALGAQQPPRAPSWKHIALDSSGAVWLALAAQSRTRVESWRNFGFGSAANHDADFVLQRLLASADLHVGPRFRAYVEAKSALLTERDLPGGRRPADADDFDLQQGYLEVAATTGQSKLAFRGGRQELLFGRQRLVSPLDWANTRRTFDAVRGTLAFAGWSADAFYGRPVRVLKSEFNTWDDAVAFAGIYAQGRRRRSLGLDVYWLALSRDAAAFNGTSGRERRHTLGARLLRPGGGPLELDLEAAAQFGSVGSEQVTAGMVSADVGWLPRRAPAGLRLHAGADYASGDAAAGGDVGTFNQLFPLGHAFLGYIDVVGRQNVTALNAGVGLKPAARIATDVTLHWLARARAADALYNAAGAVERAPGSATSRHVGTELDATAAFQFGRFGSALVGYSRFWPGAFVRATGAAGEIGFLYGSVQLTY